MAINCSFCNQEHVEGGVKMLQSTIEPDKAICAECVKWFKGMVDQKNLEDFNKNARPDDTQRGD